MRDPELWARLQTHAFDEAVDTPFSAKLAEIEGWTDDYTDRLIEEYRRFLYLTQLGADQITPSVPIDRAWHLHLTYSENYWDKLCAETIGARLHHRPCNSEADLPRYKAQYFKTLALYEAEFGGPPPADIWPSGATDDPLKSTHQRPWYRLLGFVTVICFLGMFLTGGELLNISFFIPFFGFFASILAARYLASVSKPKHQRNKSNARESWFGLEYGARGGSGSDGGGDGGGGGCGS
ncbi:MAG: hypothetical protein AAGA70_12025 [Pseudomonadota bacterium]